MGDGRDRPRTVPSTQAVNPLNVLLIRAYAHIVYDVFLLAQNLFVNIQRVFDLLQIPLDECLVWRQAKIPPIQNRVNIIADFHI
jgi:hypothetical protein